MIESDLNKYKERYILVNIGIIGTGVGIRTYLNTFKQMENANVIAISGSSKERAKRFAKENNIDIACKNYKELVNLPNIDLVCITAPNKYHFEYAKYCINANKNMILEKPATMTIEEAKELKTLINNCNKINIINHQLRFNPYLLKVKEIIEKGLLGRIYYINMHQQSVGFSNKNMKWTWSLEDQEGGGVRLAMGSHLIDLIRFWINKKILTVKGNMDVVIPKRKYYDGTVRNVTVCSFFNSNLNFENNITVNLSATCSAIGKNEFEFQIYGEDGELHFDLKNKLVGYFINDRGMKKEITVDGVTSEERDNKVSIFSGSFIYYAKQILATIENADDKLLENASKIEDAIENQIILDAIKESAITGKVIELNSGYKSNVKY